MAATYCNWPAQCTGKVFSCTARHCSRPEEAAYRTAAGTSSSCWQPRQSAVSEQRHSQCPAGQQGTAASQTGQQQLLAVACCSRRAHAQHNPSWAGGTTACHTGSKATAHCSKHQPRAHVGPACPAHRQPPACTRGPPVPLPSSQGTSCWSLEEQMLAYFDSRLSTAAVGPEGGLSHTPSTCQVTVAPGVVAHSAGPPDTQCGVFLFRAVGPPCHPCPGIFVAA